MSIRFEIRDHNGISLISLDLTGLELIGDKSAFCQRELLIIHELWPEAESACFISDGKIIGSWSIAREQKHSDRAIIDAG